MDRQAVTIKVSFIIPHKGREEMLIQTLESVSMQTLPMNQFEVIVVSQNTAFSEALHSLANTLPLSLIFNDPNKTISHSRNKGAEEAKGEFLAFLDADIALDADWAISMIDALTNDTNAVLCSAMQKNAANAPPLERIRTALSNAELDQFVTFLPGRNLFLSKTTYHTVGGFPEHLQTCEDYYFTQKVAETGRLLYTSASNYVHLGEDKAFLPMFKKEIWRGQSNLASIKGRSIPLRELPSFFIPFAVTLGVVFLLVALLYSNMSLVIMASVLTILPLAVYTGRLKKLTGGSVNMYYCLLFYCLYFPARVLGTLLGIKGALATPTHR
ncbi:MAG: glycosyltransferase family 2 protein [Alteromonadaceae bacterium TMED7]|nr:MAG: glycosyltransferase family 2 protein [Alteromonadaceae bacterium TMED7]